MSAPKSHSVVRALAREPAKWGLSPREAEAIKALLKERDEMTKGLRTILDLAESVMVDKYAGAIRDVALNALPEGEATSDARATPSVADEEK